MQIYPKMNSSGRPPLRPAARLPILLALAVVAISLVATLALWKNAQNQAERELRTEFDFQVRLTTRRIEQRMGTYEQVARGTQAFLRATSDVTREDFHIFIEGLRLEEKFPGIQGIALVKPIPKQALGEHIDRIRQQGFPEYTVHPGGSREEYSSIIQIEPFTGINKRALGFDMLTSPVRRAAMEKARDTGQAAASGKVTLIQEGSENTQPGLVMYLPVYGRGMPTDTVEQRRAAHIAWIGAPFRMNDLMARLGPERNDDVVLSIYDNGQVSDETVLYRSANSEGSSQMHESMFAVQRQISIAGRPWVLDIRSSPTYESRLEKEEPRFFAIAGTAASLMLGLLVWTLASGRRHAMTLANTMTRQLRESNAHLDAEQQRIRVILDNAHDAFIALDLGGRITDWNVKAEAIFGWTAAEAIGQDLAELCIPAEQRQAHRADFERFTATDRDTLPSSVVEVEGLQRNGRTIPLELAFAGVPTGSGYAVSAFVRDISERKEAERNDALRTKALEDARAALYQAQKMEALGNLTGGVAHDFNNVLQVISANIELLQHLYAHEEGLKARLGSMLAATVRGANLSAQLLAYARRQPLKAEVVSLGEIVGNLHGLLKPALSDDIGLQTIVAENLWNTRVDRSKLEDAILNLAINSRDAMPNGGRLIIEMRNVILGTEEVGLQPEVQPGDYVLISISDNGQGMSEEVRTKAFEPFFTTKSPGQGTGLGLSMVYGFAKQSGGHIHIKSEPGHGTCVSLFLPRSVEAAVAAPDASNPPITGGHETILVVEDELGVRTTVVSMLEGLGYRVMTADSGDAALKIVQNGAIFDLLFTDVVMPGSVSSTELAKQAKRILPQLRILFTSGYTYNALVTDGKLDRGVHLLSKPYRHDELARRIRQVLCESDYGSDNAQITAIL